MFIPLKDENPTSRYPFVTVLLISLNAFVFLYQLFSPQGLQYFASKLGLIPYELTHFQPITQFARIAPPLTLLTCMFVHGSFLHLLGNMLYFWIFGNNVEDFLGPVRFILFYLISGLGASLTQILFSPNSQVPIIGASGAIAGILGAYLVLYPRARVMTFIFLFIFIRVVPIPAAYVLGIWFIAQILNIGMGGGVAWFAHIGGFLIGMGLIMIFARGKKGHFIPIER
jgi:membrane associated rhomboid family serine protease